MKTILKQGRYGHKAAGKFYQTYWREICMREIFAVLLLFSLLGATVAEEELEPMLSDGAMQMAAGIFIVLFFMLGFVLYYFVFNREADAAVAGMRKAEPHAKFREAMGAGEKKALEILKEGNGKQTQKELSVLIKCSAPETEEIISSLEKRGLVKRIKRGRGRIVVLCSEPAHKG
ncbi:hypothetical protein GF412_05860 [Candidatus Micrarchaeota archaeon]|nr:hypothetical protein [Candidatus Micrarchaeota archaeon]MBD3418473.1 hypothetical protein [Candidatus Micrarchaeota archaeon]